MLKGRWPVCLAGSLVSLLLGTSTVYAQPEPFRGHLLNGSGTRLTCEVQGHSSDRVRFCRGGVEGNPFAPGGTYDKRVASWDGQPLDADVTLPPEGEGPWPLVVMLHGYPGNKTNLQSSNPTGNWGMNNIALARRGYAVLNYSARGMGASCGPLIAYQLSGYDTADYLFGDAACNYLYLFGRHGNWLHLGDARYEVRDTQALAGYLVEDGIAKPEIGVTGGSYGGGQTAILAQLKDRVMDEDDSMLPWTSRGAGGGTPMRVAAAGALITWSDLGNSLMPNGRPMDNMPVTQSTSPIGVKKESAVDGFYLGGLISGNYAPPGCVGPAMGRPNCPNITDWYFRMSQGEPYLNPEQGAIAEELWRYHSALSIDPPASGPAPTLMANGWTDDIFPPIEAIRLYKRTRDEYPGVPFGLELADIGHERAQNKDDDMRAIADDLHNWFNRYLRGDQSSPAMNGVKIWTHTCPASEPSRGPYRTGSWEALRRHGAFFVLTEGQTIDAGGGRADVAEAIDTNPLNDQLGIGVPPDACRQTTTWQSPGVATYQLPLADQAPRGFIMAGLPTIWAYVTTRGAGGASPAESDGQLAARLWDVEPDGEKQTLVTKGVYRLVGNQAGLITFQLNGNGWRFAPGHRPKLELLGRDDASDTFGVGSWRASNNRDFTVTVHWLMVRLPGGETLPILTTNKGGKIRLVGGDNLSGSRPG